MSQSTTDLQEQLINEDYVVCRICGYKGSSLGTHLRTHGISAKDYRIKYPDAFIRARKVQDKRRLAICEAHKRGVYQDKSKTIKCFKCQEPYITSQYTSTQRYCESCKNELNQEKVQLRWEGKHEFEDYVVCQSCGHKAENLTSHIQNTHPELIRNYMDVYPGAFIVSLNSTIRNKEYLRGQKLSDETRAKMSANAGRWNRGLTTNNHPSIASAALKMKGRKSWNLGLTKHTSEALQNTSLALQAYKGEHRTWDNGLKLNLTMDNFIPYLDEEGHVDCQAMMVDQQISRVSLGVYMDNLGLKNTRKYIKAAAIFRMIQLTQTTLETYKMSNGKISIGRAMSGLGHSFTTIKKACVRLGLPIYKANVNQELCLFEISKILKEDYISEWSMSDFINPHTGRRFRYDGYFPITKLVVEFHGYQHWTFPNCFYRYEDLRSQWEEMIKRDQIKKRMIEKTQDLNYLCICENEPFDDPQFLNSKLKNFIQKR